MTFITIQSDKILNQSKLKEFAGEKLSVAQILKFSFQSVKNIMR